MVVKRFIRPQVNNKVWKISKKRLDQSLLNFLSVSNDSELYWSYIQIIFLIGTASQGGLKKDAAMDLDDPLRTSGNNLTKKFDELRAYSKKTCLAVP